ncbi:si:dkey- isoform X1, partial [Clarias magur]
MYTYRSMESEFVLHCTSSSQWYDGSSQGSQVYTMMHSPEKMPFCPHQGLLRKDLPLFPQWIFPAVDDWTMNGNARKGLRDKLRLQSTRVAEPNKPLRPQPLPSNTLNSFSDHEMASHFGHLSSPGQVNGKKELYAHRITSPEEIKQEVLRRLQLHRQRSTPNLALISSQEANFSKSHTSEHVSSNTQSTPERKRPQMSRLHIPTFEEFKRMRQKEGAEGLGSSSASSSGVARKKGQCTERNCGENSKDRLHVGAKTFTEAWQNCSTTDEELIRGRSTEEAPDGPICTGPAPRSPLQPQSNTAGEEHTEKAGDSRSMNPADSSLVPFPPNRKTAEGPSTCCPSLLLDGKDLSSYGAKIYKMKADLLGTALDLLKKSCSAEINAKAPVRQSHDQHDGTDITTPQPGCQSACVAMTTPACRQEACSEATGREEPRECKLFGSGCRRSSSDATYEPAGSVRAQRECRLRPHYSDPMPTDAAKRKQLEMKIAAAARLHSQRRDRDNGMRTVRGHSEPRGEGRNGRLGVNRVCQHRWSTVSSVSADSGVVGLSDEREDEDELRRTGCSVGSEVERVDSGIGSGLAPAWKRPSESFKTWEAQRPCPDCGHRDTTREEGMCERCSKLRTERKEAILEFLNTETSYGEDLRIIKEEFYFPMQSAGLLTAEQLTVVFSNVQELIDVNDRFTEHLQDNIDQALDQGDEDLLTVCIGEIFLEFVNMLPAFQTYCLQQSTSVNMLNTLEKEKELLRIFLDVSQNDNTALRRMNLRSFLMAPLQRVTKYPLLLSRIIKATNEYHPDYERLKEAKSRVESHLEHINMKSKQEGTATWSLRSFRRESRKNREVINIEMRETSMKLVGWARESTRFIMEGPLQISQPADGQWVKKGSKSLKFQNVQSLLMVRTADGGVRADQTETLETVQDGVLVLIKDKSSGKFAILREPIHLANCVISTDPDCDDTFEVLDIRREAFVLRASDKSRTQQWFRLIKRYACDLGFWRKRRNALPNIMINTSQS